MTSVRGDGSEAARVMVVSAFPSDAEVQSGKPMGGRLGEIVRGAVTGIVGDDVWFTTLAKHRPAKGRFRRSDIDHAALDRELYRISPEVIVCLGNHVSSFFLGQQVVMEHVRGLPVSIYHPGLEKHITYLPAYDIGFVMRKGGLTSPTGLGWIEDLEELHGLL